MAAPPPSSGWIAELWPRFCAQWAWKLTGTTLGMTAFFVIYFYLLRHPARPPFVLPLIALDRWVPFSPLSLVLYLSLWIYVSAGPALLLGGRELLSYGLGAAVLAVIGLGTFYFWPTIIPPSEVDWSVHPHFAFLKTLDAAGNACPSLHVAFAVFTGAWLERILRHLGAGAGPRLFNAAWCVGIVYSTISTRQHVALDALAGAALGLAVVAVHFRFTDEPASLSS
ncbi:MAG TPA: phosphatase PAP2 family protein [Candidatus Didemnitutus sp.]|nr:phosphatase PAP2 family protein [Candidatus Didemnitutus sp.]